MKNLKDLPLDASWQYYLKDEFEKEYMQKLQIFLQQESEQGKVIYPEENQYFNALNLTPFKQVKVVILGQDPYHGEGQAHGLSFSVLPHTRKPPSLVNIYKELSDDLSVDIPGNGCLTHWAEQGVLLLNSVLTVEKNKAAAHQSQGWEQFTNKIIQQLNAHSEGLVFILWGGYAQKKAAFIDAEKHCVLKSVHPSPLSSYRGFFSSRPFSKTNHYLEETGKSPIQW
ncbi:MAG: uracil-DNA glycosylase [Methyloprofundus sp.]|nr:uracil-DNA glycosylase [Methyloprofundus sp.]